HPGRSVSLPPSFIVHLPGSGLADHTDPDPEDHRFGGNPPSNTHSRTVSSFNQPPTEWAHAIHRVALFSKLEFANASFAETIPRGPSDSGGIRWARKKIRPEHRCRAS